MATTNPLIPALKRADYKAIKRMDREAMTAYLTRLYRRGYEAGVKAAASAATQPKATDE